MSETFTSQDPVSYYIDPTIYKGRPADTSDRLPKEVRTYDLLDSLGVSYERVDHDTLPTMEACQEVDKLLGIEICKNLFLRNTQKTDFYLLLLPGNKNSKQLLFPNRSAAPVFPLLNRNLWNSIWTLLPVLSVFSV